MTFVKVVGFITFYLDRLTDPSTGNLSHLGLEIFVLARVNTDRIESSNQRSQLFDLRWHPMERWVS